MHKDNSGVGEWCKHTRKRTGLRRMVNKRERLNSRRILATEIEEDAEDAHQEFLEFLAWDGFEFC